MAKAKRSRVGRDLSNSRYTRSLAPRLSRPTRWVPVTVAPSPYSPQALLDGRMWSPYKHIAPAPQFNVNANKLVVRDKFGDKLRKAVPVAVHFKEPSAVSVCVRRKQRREVLHALGRTGRHGKSKIRRNTWSDVSC